MHQADRIAHWIDNENGATIGDINSKANAALICDQAVATVEALVPCGRLIDNTDARAVHLLRGHERRVTEPVFSSDFPMNAVQARERLHFVVRHFDAGNTLDETVNDVGQHAERRKMFSRKLTLVHLPELVRVVLVVRTGCLSPA